ncbi:hypothetical protein PoB_003046500 [Plakobranchus ocellatus]|uniref:Uncharacterized protein n=1 Tax=Plakobranchus ocellatus TaxID=259542 RepID=A0AAV4AAT9_9GAST|nr:hypothetical protein PoB_003046500 [Plakobranchus ocellatus]
MGFVRYAERSCPPGLGMHKSFIEIGNSSRVWSAAGANLVFSDDGIGLWLYGVTLTVCQMACTDLISSISRFSTSFVSQALIVIVNVIVYYRYGVDNDHKGGSYSDDVGDNDGKPDGDEGG